jgi:hypothetical protein
MSGEFFDAVFGQIVGQNGEINAEPLAHFRAQYKHNV